MCEVQSFYTAKMFMALVSSLCVSVRSEVSVCVFCFRKSDWEGLKISILKFACYHIAHCALNNVFSLMGYNEKHCTSGGGIPTLLIFA